MQSQLLVILIHAILFMFYRQYQDYGGFGRGDEIVVLADRDGFRPRHRSPALTPRGNTPSTAILICINYLCMRETRLFRTSPA